MKYYYTDIYGDNGEPMDLGFAKAFMLAKQSDSRHLIILAKTKGGLGALEDTFEKVVAQLQKNGEIIIEGVKIKLATIRSGLHRNEGVLFGLEVEFDALVDFERTNNLEAIVYSPHDTSEQKSFVKKYEHAVKLSS